MYISLEKDKLKCIGDYYMIDIHAHILPGIDDGPNSIDEAMNMLQIAQEQGITDIILTPHYIQGEQDNTRDVVINETKKLSEYALNEGISIKLYPGSEVLITPRLVKLVESKTVCTLNDKKYVLIELPMSVIPEYTKQVIYELTLGGYVPVLAHPERNMEIAAKPEKLIELVDLGALVQLNAPSFLGAYGKSVQKAAYKFIKWKCVSFIASDMHSENRRAPRMSEAMSVCKKKLRKDRSFMHCFTNASIIINDQPFKVGRD